MLWGALLCTRDFSPFSMSGPHLAPVSRFTPEISLSEMQMEEAKLFP